MRSDLTIGYRCGQLRQFSDKCGHMKTRAPSLTVRTFVLRPRAIERMFAVKLSIVIRYPERARSCFDFGFFPRHIGIASFSKESFAFIETPRNPEFRRGPVSPWRIQKRYDFFVYKITACSWVSAKFRFDGPQNAGEITLLQSL